MNEEPTPEDVFISEVNTYNTYCRKLANASMFLHADFNGMTESERFNRYKEFRSEIENTQTQINQQRENVIAAYNALFSHNRQ